MYVYLYFIIIIIIQIFLKMLNFCKITTVYYSIPQRKFNFTGSECV